MDQAVLPAAPDIAPVTRVVRVSRSLIQGSVMAELFEQRARLTERHRAAGLCAAMVCSSGWLVTWIEGPPDAVRQALDASALHACHAEPRLIHRSTGPRVLVEPMAVGVTQWPESTGMFRRRIAAVEGAQGLGPCEVWRLLSEPSSLPGAPLAGPLRPRRIAVLSADDNRSIDEVRRIAERFGRPMVYQRFASGDVRSGDVGGAYVDLSLGTGPVRLQVVSRRALEHGLVRDSLGAVHKLAVLLGSGVRAAMELAAGVAALLAGGGIPAIELVASSPEVAHVAREFLASRVEVPLDSHVGGGRDTVLGLIARLPPAARA